jgi:hypothetical protein
MFSPACSSIPGRTILTIFVLRAVPHSREKLEGVEGLYCVIQIIFAEHILIR